MNPNYEKMAQDWLEGYGFILTIKAATPKTPLWHEEGKAHGHHYRVSLKHPSTGKKTAFSFWGSIHDAENSKKPSAYDVLACISSDQDTPDTFKDFCADFGYEKDSIKALKTFKACTKLAANLRRVIQSDDAREALREIR